MLTLRRRLEREEGVTLILFAFLMVALLGLAGLVVDFGLVRTDRQRNKSAADVAVAAGLQALNVSNSVVPARGACEALDYLQVNHPELSGLNTGSGWTNGNGATIPGGDPCDSATPSAAHANLWNATCSATAFGARPSFVWFTGSTGAIDVKIRAGFDANDINSGGFGDEAAHSDKGAADQYGCDQLAVIVTERENAGLGRVVGGDQLQSTIRSVGRLTIEESSESAVALLLIEPTDCRALDIDGAGSGTNVRVKGTGTRPGIIHADSLGTTSCNGGAKVLLGEGANAIYAEQAPDAPHAPGIISVTALNGPNPSNAYDSTTNVVAQGGAPQGGGAKGRAPVDQRFLGLATSTSPSYGMTQLRSDSSTAFGITNAAEATAAGYGAYYTNCNALPNPITVAKVFIACDVTNTTAFASTVTDITIKGNIDLNSSAVVTIPNARNVLVYGKTGPNAKGVSIGSSAQLLVNTNGLTGTNVCTNRQMQIDAASDPKPVTKFVVGNGQFKAGSTGTMRMCGTTLFLMDGSLPTSEGTAPANNSYNGGLSVTAGATLDWTAPNRTNLTPTAAQIKELEDLAFWSESSSGHSLNGSGANISLKGIFFTPNANAFSINAGGAGIVADAQFITRKLIVAGGGTLSMTADPNNSVPIKLISGYSLVR